MGMKKQDYKIEPLPQCVRDYITLVIRKMGYRRKVRQDVGRELEAHFADALRHLTSETEKSNTAQTLINDFGDPKLLATLLRRGKKRCRPVWKKGLIRVAQTVLVLYVISLVSNAYVLQTWKKNPRDYLAEFNRQGKRDFEESENAYTCYRKASEQFVQMPQDLESYIENCSQDNNLAVFRSMSRKEKNQLRQWLEDNTESWKAIEQGGRLDYFWWKMPDAPLDPLNTEQFDFVMHFLSSYRNLAQFGGWKAIWAFEEGQNQEGIETLFAVFRMGSHLTGGRLVIEYLSGVAIINLSTSEILEQLKEKKFGSQDLELIRKKWGYESVEKLFQFPWESDMLYALAMVNKTLLYTQDKKMYFIPGQYFWLGNRENLDREAGMLLNKLKEHESKHSVSSENKGKPFFRPLIPKGLFDMSYESSASLMKSMKNHIIGFHAFLSILALHQFQMEKGVFPESVPELLDGGYLKPETMTPYIAGLLKYERRGENFTLYSVGLDTIQAGVKRNPIGSVKVIASNGENSDRVFWPVN